MLSRRGSWRPRTLRSRTIYQRNTILIRIFIFYLLEKSSSWVLHSVCWKWNGSQQTGLWNRKITVETTPTTRWTLSVFVWERREQAGYKYLENIWRTTQIMMNIRPKITRIPTIRGSTKKEFLELTAGSSRNKTRISEDPSKFLSQSHLHRPLVSSSYP